MCAVSAMIDNLTRPYSPLYSRDPLDSPPSRAEFELMKQQFEREIKGLRELLPHVQKYDRMTGQPDCESDEKLKLLRGIADKLGVNVEGIA